MERLVSRQTRGGRRREPSSRSAPAGGEIQLGRRFISRRAAKHAASKCKSSENRLPGEIAVFVLNRDLSQAREVELFWEDRSPGNVSAAAVLTGTDLKAINTFDNPKAVVEQPAAAKPVTSSGRTRFEVPPRSYTVFQFGAPSGA